VWGQTLEMHPFCQRAKFSSSRCNDWSTEIISMKNFLGGHRRPQLLR